MLCGWVGLERCLSAGSTERTGVGAGGRHRTFSHEALFVATWLGGGVDALLCPAHLDVALVSGKLVP